MILSKNEQTIYDFIKSRGSITTKVVEKELPNLSVVGLIYTLKEKKAICESYRKRINGKPRASVFWKVEDISNKKAYESVTMYKCPKCGKNSVAVDVCSACLKKDKMQDYFGYTVKVKFMNTPKLETLYFKVKGLSEMLNNLADAIKKRYPDKELQSFGIIKKVNLKLMVM